MNPLPSRFAAGALLLGVCIWLAGLTRSSSLGAESTDPPSPQQIRGTLDEAEALLDSGKPAKARGKLTAAVKQLDSLLELDRLPSGTRGLVDACKSLKEQLALEEVDVSGIKIPDIKSAAGKAAAAKPPAKPADPPDAAAFLGPRPGAAGGPQAVSFVKQVAPILMSRCGGCHVTGRKGGFQMASYEGLMKTGAVQRGVGDASRLVEVIESGDMPRGGGKVGPDELATLKRWIDAGAAYDAPDPTVGIDMLARPLGEAAPVAAAMPAMSATPAGPVTLKPGDVSFAFDIAPVLLKNCCGCHDDDDPEENLSMVTFARLMRGGESGPAVNAGQAAESLLLRKIKGTGIDGQRMPIGKPPLSPEVIALVEKWIAQGARLDLLTPKDPLENLAAAGRARSLSHEELLKVRQAASGKLWQRVIGDEEPLIEPRGDMYLIGNSTKSQMEAVAIAAEQALEASQRLLVGTGKPLLKGGVAVYVFAKPYDYSTFWQEVLDDERPKGLGGHAGLKGDVAYGALVVPAANAGTEEDEVAAELTALVAEQIAAAAFLSRGSPDWFASGAGRVVAMRAAAKAPCVKEWRREATEQLQRLGSAADYFDGQAGPVATAAIGGGFVAAIARPEAKLRMLIEAIDAGASFDKAFGDIFKSPPQSLFEAWAAQEARKPAGSGRR